MKKIHWVLLTTLLCLTARATFSQSASDADSTRPRFTFKTLPWYGRLMPLSVYTGAAQTRDRIAQYLEIGKSFDVVDLGIAVGRNSLRPDTTTFVQAKVTMDVANYGIFANEMTIGAGRVFDPRGSLMLELTYNIFCQVADHWGVGITTGYYDFSNSVFDNSRTFYGLFLRYGLQRTDSGGLLGMGRPRSRPGRTRGRRTGHHR